MIKIDPYFLATTTGNIGPISRKRSNYILPFAVFIISVFTSCDNNNNNKMTTSDSSQTTKTGITKIDWGEHDGKKVYLYTLVNSKGTEVKITNYGGIVTSFLSADKNGNKSNIVIGFDSLKPYLQSPP